VARSGFCRRVACHAGDDQQADQGHAARPDAIVNSLVDTVGGRTEEQLAFRFAELLNQEALVLAEAGASVIQFDEPCFNVYVDKVKDWGIAALERAARGVTVKKAVHICYGYGTPDVKRWKSGNTDWSHYEHTLPLIFLAPLPLLATLMVAWDDNQPWYVASYVAVGCLVSAVAAMLMRPADTGVERRSGFASTQPP
jgi:hypothetical protein